jgi:hypothetical protein
MGLMRCTTDRRSVANLGNPVRRSQLQRLLPALLVALSFDLGACESDEKAKPVEREEDAAVADASVEPAAPYAQWADPFIGLPSGDALRAQVCESPQTDIVLRKFCAEEPPQLGSLRDLQDALGLDPENLRGISGSALTGHSTSLSTRSISAINPRVIMFRMVVALLDQGRGPIEFVTLAFGRGELFAEIAVMDADKNYKFYLVRFEQPCNEEPEGCRPGELLTEAVEHDWHNVTLYDEKSLENTVLDCKTCHQPNGPGSASILRMQEFASPWTHWFFNSSEGGRALVEDYTRAKGYERIAGLPREAVGGVSPGGLSTIVSGRDFDQPNVFDSAKIESEVKESAALEGGMQPMDNRIPGTSATWQAAYDRFKHGESIPVPYHDVKITDPDKLDYATEAYRAYARGEMDARDLPDLRDVFPDDHGLLARMGMSTEPGLSGEEVLIQACSMCHNDKLDQDLSRARFRADLDGMSRGEKDYAIARLMLPPNDPRAMPPARLRVLSEEARERAIEALRK